MNKKGLIELKKKIKGQVLTPESPEYDDARTIWNARINRRPALIIQSVNTSDIVETINYAREYDALLSIKAGGHNHVGFAVCEGGIMLDVSKMKGAELNPEKKSIKVQPGHTFADFDHETHKAGLASTGAIISMVGVPGYALGGGIGWLHRRAGLGCDNLVSAEVVTADGELVLASEKENSDLYWALRGGGGNFGVVSTFEFKVHPVENVLAGLIFHPLEDLPEVASFIRDFVEKAPDELCVWMLMRRAPASALLPESLHGRHVVIIAACYSGSLSKGEEVLKPLRKFGKPIADLIKRRPYPDWQKALDPAWGNGFHNEWMGHYIQDLDDSTIDTLLEYVSRVTSPYTDVKLAHMEGAIKRVGENETAFSYRNSKYAMVIQTRWQDPYETEKHLKWTHDFFNAMKSHGTGKVYVNFIADEGDKRVRDAYNPTTFKRLQKVKAKYDPDNMFRMNQNIKPAL
jgi:FAD/FMN-containing dehydrogenase